MVGNLYKSYQELYSNYLNDPRYVFRSFLNEWIMVLEKIDKSYDNEYQTIYNDPIISNPKLINYAKFVGHKLKIVFVFNKFNPKLILKQFKYITNPLIKKTYYYKSPIVPFYSELNNIQRYTGKFLLWHDNGMIKLDGNYTYGIKNDKWIEYFDNGKIRSVGNFSNDKMNGEWILYFNNYQINVTYDSGKYIGKVEIILKDIKIALFHFAFQKVERTKIIFERKKKKICLDGTYIEYYNDGILKSSGKFLNGLKFGEWIENNVKLQTYAKGKYFNGKKHKHWTVYYYDGTIKKRLFY